MFLVMFFWDFFFQLELIVILDFKKDTCKTLLFDCAFTSFVYWIFVDSFYKLYIYIYRYIFVTRNILVNTVLLNFVTLIVSLYYATTLLFIKKIYLFFEADDIFFSLMK